MRWIVCMVTLVAAACCARAWTNRPWAYTAPPPRVVEREASLPAAEHDSLAQGRAAFAAASAALGAGEIEAAGSAIRDALARLPSDGMVLGLAGRVFTFEGNHGLAENVWRRILASFPENATARAGLAATLLYGGRPDDARKELAEARALDAADRTVRFYSAVLAARDGDTNAVAAAFADSRSSDIRLFAEQIRQEARLLHAVLKDDAYRGLVGGLVGSSVAGSPDHVIQALVTHLGDAERAARSGSWSAFEASLIAARDAGLVSPSLDFDIAFARYWQAPGVATLDAVEAVVLRSPRDLLARNFALLCLQIGETERAARVSEPILANSPHKESTLLRAAIRMGTGDPNGAWGILDAVPTTERSAWIRWFDQPQPAIRALRADPRFAAWHGGT